MTNENFRRELNQVIDDMAGSPSAALSDRVRSSVAAAPEQRGPFWIAGLAAAIIAALVVGVLLVADPLNRLPWEPDVDIQVHGLTKVAWAPKDGLDA